MTCLMFPRYYWFTGTLQSFDSGALIRLVGMGRWLARWVIG
jgi:hypothetical protein